MYPKPLPGTRPSAAWHSSGAANTGPQPPRAARSALGGRGALREDLSPAVPGQWSQAPSCLSPAGPGGDRARCPVWLLPLCRPWPLAGGPGPGGPHRRCPLLGPHRATGSRRGGWGWGAAPSPDCPASLPGSSPSGSRPSLAAGGDLPCLGDSEGAAAGENPPAPPAAEGGKGKGARGAPPASRPPLPACRSPMLRGAAPASDGPGCPGRLPSTGPGPARPAAPALRRSQGREAKLDPPAQPHGDAAEYARQRPGRPRRQGALGAAGDGMGTGWGRDRDAPRSSTACAARRLPAAHLSGEGGREPGSALPFPRPPSSVPAARSRALPRHGARSAPPARPLPPEGTGQPPRAAGGRGVSPHTSPWAVAALCSFPHCCRVFPHCCRVFPQLCSIFHSVLIFVPLRSRHSPRLGKGPRHIQHAITGAQLPFLSAVPKFSRTQS